MAKILYFRLMCKKHGREKVIVNTFDKCNWVCIECEMEKFDLIVNDALKKEK